MNTKPAQLLAQKQGSILKFLLSFIFVLFIAILVTVYLVARRANPILLDEHGKPVNSQTAGSPAKPY